MDSKILLTVQKASKTLNVVNNPSSIGHTDICRAAVLANREKELFEMQMSGVATYVGMLICVYMKGEGGKK